MATLSATRGPMIFPTVLATLIRLRLAARAAALVLFAEAAFARWDALAKPPAFPYVTRPPEPANWPRLFLRYALVAMAQLYVTRRPCRGNDDGPDCISSTPGGHQGEYFAIRAICGGSAGANLPTTSDPTPPDGAEAHWRMGNPPPGCRRIGPRPVHELQSHEPGLSPRQRRPGPWSNSTSRAEAE